MLTRYRTTDSKSRLTPGQIPPSMTAPAFGLECRPTMPTTRRITKWGNSVPRKIMSVISGADSAPGGSSSLPFRSHMVRNRSCCTTTANCLFASYLSIYTLVALVSYIDQNAIILSVEYAFPIVTNQNLTGEGAGTGPYVDPRDRQQSRALVP